MSKHTGIYLNRVLAEHDTGPHNPERPQRLHVIADAIETDAALSKLPRIHGEPVTNEQMQRVHTPDYLLRVAKACHDGADQVDSDDCQICPHTFDLAREAAGGVLAATDEVMAGNIQNAFCVVRPPGHHAERDKAMGFCFLSNVALAARHLRDHHRVDRVLILDFDVHHGNGTQHIFDADPTVFFCSIHEDPRYLYPGMGFAHERGIGPGEGTTLNLPMLPHTGNDDYKQALTESFLPAARAFEPQFILVSAGFDAHRDDSISHIDLSVEAYVWMSEMVQGLARDFCDGRLVSVLEGGYNLAALRDCVLAHLGTLASDA